jgi:hypothetical protein
MADLTTTLPPTRQPTESMTDGAAVKPEAGATSGVLPVGGGVPPTPETTGQGAGSSQDAAMPVPPGSEVSAPTK